MAVEYGKWLGQIICRIFCGKNQSAEKLRSNFGIKLLVLTEKNKTMKKIIISLSIIAAVAIIAIGATTSFFSDTETSTGNTFTAGEIDLTVDNTSYRSNGIGDMMLQGGTTWDLRNLTNELFFNFSDLKPGDLGEDTVSLHVNSNDAWLCATIDITANNDVTCTEPERGDDPNCDASGSFNGELARDLNFIFWADDGDNVLENNEEVIVQGPASQVLNGVTYALADSGHTNVWTRQSADPMDANDTKYIGKAWCFGTLTRGDVAQDQGSNPTINPGVTCNGASVNNAAQSDNLMGNITFYAEQARNNPGFVCSAVRTKTLILDNKNQNWERISDDKIGTLTYQTSGDTFSYNFTASGLQITGVEYKLIYYADKQDRYTNWGGDSPGAVIGTFTASGSGNISVTSQSINLGMDLPAANDWNGSIAADYCVSPDFYNMCRGAKIWLVPSSDYDSTAKKLTSWNPANYLFETDLIIYSDTNN
ncbi:M73 family metallopeptidase [Patescibacteria group bacterium]|nr:M73 family metallopeptidase [Patescibacteria group bacterium]